MGRSISLPKKYSDLDSDSPGLGRCLSDQSRRNPPERSSEEIPKSNIVSFLDLKELGTFIQTSKENFLLKTNDQTIQLKEIVVSSRNVLAGILSFKDVSNNSNYKFIIDNLVIKVQDITNEELNELLNNLDRNQLKTLNLGNCRLITNAGLVHLANLTSLQTLDLGFCRLKTNAGLGHLANLRSLQTLDLRGCIQITDAGIYQLTSSLPNTQIIR